MAGALEHDYITFALILVFMFSCLQSSVKERHIYPKGASLLQIEAKDKVWTQGCIDALKSWINRNLYIVAGAALGVALMQVTTNV